MNMEEVIEYLDVIIKTSSYYFYDDEKKKNKAIKMIKKLKKHLKKGNIDKVIVEVDDDD